MDKSSGVIQKMKVLSVGCGGGKKYRGTTMGDVNIDIEIPIIKIPNFVRASVEYLPFTGNAFDVVKAFNVLEHVKNWTLGLEETLRVSNVGTIVRVDGLFIPVNWVGKEHKWVNVGKLFLKRNRFVKTVTFFLNYRPFSSFFYRFGNLISRWDYYFMKKKSGKWVKIKSVRGEGQGVELSELDIF